MFALSTSWNSRRHVNGFDLVDEIRDLGFEYIELNFSLTRKMVDEILSLKEKGLVKVTSLHNMCPLPEEVEPIRASPEYYSLASLDEEERSRALKATKNTIYYAKKFDARAAILHIGRVEVEDRTRELAAAFDDKDKYETMKSQMVKERDEKKRPFFDSSMKSLRELVRFSKEIGIALAIENRYYYREMPSTTELEAIFNSFGQGEIYYWHDVGHAEVNERLGLDRHESLLEKFGSRLLGIHFHDIMGLIRDHRAPLCGTFDFKRLIPYVREDTLKVIEAHSPATKEDILRGHAYLKKLF